VLDSLTRKCPTQSTHMYTFSYNILTYYAPVMQGVAMRDCTNMKTRLGVLEGHSCAISPSVKRYRTVSSSSSTSTGNEKHHHVESRNWKVAAMKHMTLNETTKFVIGHFHLYQTHFSHIISLYSQFILRRKQTTCHKGRQLIDNVPMS